MRYRNKALIAVMGILTGCASPHAPSPFPVEAAEDCAIPYVEVTTNGGLAKGVADLRASLRLCNKDKATVREWLDGKPVL